MLKHFYALILLDVIILINSQIATPPNDVSLIKLSLFKLQTKDDRNIKRESIGTIDENLYGKPSEGYFTSIFLGDPPQEIKVLIDTGSSNFAVAGEAFSSINHYFNPHTSKSFKDLKVKVEVPYTQGHWQGYLGSDMFSIKNVYHESFNSSQYKEISTRVKVAVIENFTNFFIDSCQWSGILGLGYSRLSRPNTNVIPVFDQLVIDKKVSNIFSIQLCSYYTLYSKLNRNLPSGTLIFGGVHKSLYFGDIFYTPIVRKWYYEVVITDISVEGTTLGFSCDTYNNDRTIVDTGTTNFRVYGIIFDAIIERMKQNEKIGIPDDFWQGYELMCWNFGNTPFSLFPDITISLSSAVSDHSQFSLTITPQLYLREAENENLNSVQKCYRFAISKSEKGIVIGAVFMEGFLVIFDRENSQIGFAQSSCHEKGKLFSNSRILSLPDLNYSTKKCNYIESFEETETIMKLVVFVFLGISLISVIPSILMLIKAAIMIRET